MCMESNQSTKEEIELIVVGGSVNKPLSDIIILSEIKNEKKCWSFLVMGGYLRYDNYGKADESSGFTADISMPNRELLTLFQDDIVPNWFRRPNKTQKLELLTNTLTHGDFADFETEFIDYCMTSFSYFDVGGEEPEKFYHAFILGLLVFLRDKYHIRSNRESGLGRYDVTLTPKDISQRGVIFEFKKVDKKRGQTFESEIEEALYQYKDKKYETEMRAVGVTEIVHIIVAFEGKECQLRIRN
jgi:hypothetical protein